MSIDKDIDNWIEDISGFEPVFSYHMICPDCGLSVVYELGDPMCGIRVYCPECKIELERYDEGGQL